MGFPIDYDFCANTNHKGEIVYRVGKSAVEIVNSNKEVSIWLHREDGSKEISRFDLRGEVLKTPNCKNKKSKSFSQAPVLEPNQVLRLLFLLTIVWLVPDHENKLIVGQTREGRQTITVSYDI